LRPVHAYAALHVDDLDADDVSGGIAVSENFRSDLFLGSNDRLYTITNVRRPPSR
jgi:hypothetical protein